MSSVTSSISQINSTKKYSDNLFNVFYPAIISKYKTDYTIYKCIQLINN